MLLDLAPVVLDAGNRAAQAADAFLQLTGTWTCRAGTWGSPRTIPTLPTSPGGPGARLRLVVADGLAVHDRGAADALELAASIAQG